jgi:hypothetical protein
MPTAPFYATFYYPWYQNPATDGAFGHWQDEVTPGYFHHAPCGSADCPPEGNWNSHYLPDQNGNWSPTTNLYSSADVQNFYWQLDEMKAARQTVAIASWWGQNDSFGTDANFRRIITDYMNRPDNPYPNMRWALYYELEGYGDPSVAQLDNDLNYIKANYASQPGYLWVNGKPVIFVYNSYDGLPGYPDNDFDRWAQARSDTGFYVDMKIQPVSEGGINPSLMDGWHEYGPANQSGTYGGLYYFISPGFWKEQESPRLPRDTATFTQAAQAMVNANVPWKFTETWNEWIEGTSVEPGLDANWTYDSSATVTKPNVATQNGTGYGTSYVDILAATLPPLPSSPEPYHPITPFRIKDTRSSHQTLGPNTTLNVQVSGVDGVPAAATAAVLNVTATNPTKQSFLTVFPTGRSPPVASNLNFGPGESVANLAEVEIGNNGEVSVYNPTGNVDVVVDLEGYTAPSSPGTGLYNALAPARITDTRPGSGFPNAGNTLGPNTTLTVQVTGAQGVRGTGVGAAVLNVTATNPTEQSFLTVWPTGASRPTASNLNFAPGQTVPNRVIVPVSSPGGQVSIFNPAGNVDVVVDVGGYFTDSSNAAATGAQFTPTTPVRITDTRPGSGFPNEGNTLGPNTTLPVQMSGVGPVPASGVTAAVMNVTVTNTTQSSFLTVFPSDLASPPSTSDLNWVAGETVPNLVVTTLGSNGAVKVFNASGSTDVVMDVSGWYS